MLTNEEIWNMMANEMKLFRQQCTSTHRRFTFVEMAEHVYTIMYGHDLINKDKVYKPVPEPGPNLTSD